MMAVLSINAQESVYNQKLDSVVGSNDFDWTRFKDVFTYYVEDAVIQDDYYLWENGEWVLSKGYVYQYSPDFLQILGAIALTAVEEGLTPTSLAEYEYDELNHLTRIMHYAVGDTSWVENSKYEYTYNAEGLRDTCLYSTIRNGNWNASERIIYTYDEGQRCTRLNAQRKGGWGPSANQWRDSYRYDFEYENDELMAEYYYIAMGWFGGGEMSLDSKWEYEYDANGNLLRKTGSVFNEEDWIVRDVYENRFDVAVEASRVLGLEPFWQTNVRQGMGYTSGADMPLVNQWLSGSVISADHDSEFTLYCSGFEGVEEEQSMPLRAWTHNGRLVVNCDQAADIMVFDLMGRRVASETQTVQCEFHLTPGLYIVSDGQVRVKAIVE